MNPASADLPRPAPATRIDFIDHAKAIGIVLVVLGHAPGLAPWAFQLIYAFHMPLFFFAAGFLVSVRTLQLPLPEYLRKLGRDLGLPYLLFFAISYGYWLITRNMGSRAGKFVDVNWYDPLTGFVLGMGDMRLVNPVLWFFPGLAVVALLFRLLYGWVSGKVWPAVVLAGLISAVGLLVAHLSQPVALPFSAEIAVNVLAFYALGVLLRQHGRFWPGEWRSAQRVGLVLAAALTLVALAAVNGRVDLAEHRYGDYLWLLFAEAGAGIVLLLGLGSLLARNTISSWLARNTLTIFPMHVLFFNVISGVAKLGFGMPDGFSNTTGWALIYSAIGLALCVPAVFVLRRLFPGIVAR